MSLAFDIICILLSLVFFWSTLVVAFGLLRTSKTHPKSDKKLKFAVLVCARNEEKVIKFPVKSVLMSKYPADCREVIVLADNCSDATARIAREAGATVWEKTTPSTGKGDVLTWGIDKVLSSKQYDAIAVFDADNIVSDEWFNEMNDALNDGELIVTGCRHSSNAKANIISGWYTVYWDMMNELSNRVRTNLTLSGKLTGTGFAFLPAALENGRWSTKTLVEDTEFTVQSNLRGNRVAYVPKAYYADEQPETAYSMWRQLRRWATGGWQVVRYYFLPWFTMMCKQPSFRLFDSFFAIIIGISVAFVHLFNIINLIVKLSIGYAFSDALMFFMGVLGFLFAMGWVTGFGAVALSLKKRSPKWISVITFPIFSLILSASVLVTLVYPTRRWKPIEHRGGN